MLKDPIDILCKKLKDATSGMTTDEEPISRIIGGNHRHVVQQIIARFHEKYDLDLKKVARKQIL